LGRNFWVKVPQLEGTFNWGGFGTLIFRKGGIRKAKEGKGKPSFWGSPTLKGEGFLVGKLWKVTSKVGRN